MTINKNFKDGIVISQAILFKIVMKLLKNLKKLEKIGLINIPSIKPLNKSKIKNLLKKTKKVFTIEDHNIYGGLGSVILEALSDLEQKPKVYMHGLKDVFIQSDEVENLYRYYGLDANGIFKFINKNI